MSSISQKVNKKSDEIDQYIKKLTDKETRSLLQQEIAKAASQLGLDAAMFSVNPH